MTKQHRVDMVEGDITRVKTDAIANAANTGLLKGDGVCERFSKPLVLIG